MLPGDDMQLNSIKRVLEKYPYLNERKIGFPNVGKRKDNENFSKIVKDVSDGFEFYDNLMKKYYDPKKDHNFTSGNPLSYPIFPSTKEALINTINSDELYKYPYSEGDDKVRTELLKYIEQEGINNDNPYEYSDIDEKGLSIHNLTLTVSTSHAFDLVLEVIAREGDVILMTGPNYGLFSFKPERKNINVEIINLEVEDNYLINPKKLDKRIKEINKLLEEKNKDKNYIPKVVAFVNSNPCNPTGKVMGKNEINILKDLGEVCLNNDCFIIDDLIYRDITYDRENITLPIASIKGMFKNTISLFGLSKSYGLASLRAGFIVADEVIIREIINKIFQQMDAVPAIIGEVLKAAFNTSYKRNKEYDKYFTKLNNEYCYRYNLLKALVMGINTVESKYKHQIIEDIKRVNNKAINIIDKGIDGINILNNLEPKAGFFVILDFTKLKGKKYNDIIINNEETLTTLFYKNIHLRFIMGKSLAWPNKEQLIGRFTFAKSIDDIINAFYLINELVNKLN